MKEGKIMGRQQKEGRGLGQKEIKAVRKEGWTESYHQKERKEEEEEKEEGE